MRIADSSALSGAKPLVESAAALAAVEQLSDPRRLSTIAKSEASDAVRAAALARTTDERALGAIARHAARETTAMDALRRLSDPAEMVDVAVRVKPDVCTLVPETAELSACWAAPPVETTIDMCF